METLPVDASVYVYMTNSPYPFIFTVGYESLERFHYWSSGNRFKSLRSLHRYCSAHGNLLRVEVHPRETVVRGDMVGAGRYERPVVHLTSGELQRSRLPKRDKKLAC